MITAFSARSRRLLIRLDRGADLVRATLEQCQQAGIQCGSVSAMGLLTEAQLYAQDGTRGLVPGRRLSGPLCLCSFYGTLAEENGALSLSATVTLSRETDNGVQMVGGLLAQAKVQAIEVIVTAFDDVLIRRERDDSIGMSVWAEAIGAEPDAAPTPVRPAIPAPPAHNPKVQEAERAAKEAGAYAMQQKDPAKIVAKSAPAGDWESVKAVSEKRRGIDEVISAALSDPPRRGDVLDHPTFGRCTVDRCEDDRLWIRAARSGRMIQVSLDVLALELVGQEGTGRLFRAGRKGPAGQ